MFDTVIFMESRTITIGSLDSLQTFSRELLQAITVGDRGAATVIALSGDLGAGKTTFVQTLARELGVAGTVTSPTFTIMKTYTLENQDWDRLIHMDAYRIDELAELEPLRFGELLNDPKNLFCIEWAEKIKAALVTPKINVQFTITNGHSRTVQVS